MINLTGPESNRQAVATYIESRREREGARKGFWCFFFSLGGGDAGFRTGASDEQRKLEVWRVSTGVCVPVSPVYAETRVEQKKDVLSGFRVFWAPRRLAGCSGWGWMPISLVTCALVMRC